MELIPLIYLKKRQILPSLQKSPLTPQELIEQIENDQPLYCYDLDGIEDNKPNLCTYQRLANHLNLWIDTGPRDLGDVVDIVFAGANTITIRPHLWTRFQLQSIREITENQLFLNYPPLHQRQDPNFSYQDADGIILPPTTEDSRDFKNRTHIKNLSAHTKIYVMLSDYEQLSSWENLDVTGFLVELTNLQEFKKHVH
jgi:hypothetical protein